ncbi:MAG: MobA/MobL family protein [Heliomarina sp.]|uniref:MobA/MobL family protein n=1 Tax=Heliomarina sp. TaxID=2917556 RepID=UPI004059E144
MLHRACNFSISIKGRSNCASLLGAVAYRIGGSLFDHRLGLRKSYRSKRDVVSVEMIRGGGDIEGFWNLVDASETRINARVAREFLISLPAELPLDTQRGLVRGFCLWLHDQYRISSLAAIHHPHADGADREILRDLIPQTEGRIPPKCARGDGRGDPRNHHVHILCPTREYLPDEGRFGKKLRHLDDKVTGPEIVQACRDEWQKRVNVALARHGVKQRVDLRSYEKMVAAGDAPDGLVPQRKLGPKNTARGRRFEIERGHDVSFMGRERKQTQDHNAVVWSCWMKVRALERERSRVLATEIAAAREAARRAEAATARAKIKAARSEADAAEAIASAPHLDCLDPLSQAIAWANSGASAPTGGEFDKFVDLEDDSSVAASGALTPPSEPVKATIRHKARGRRRQRQEMRS